MKRTIISLLVAFGLMVTLTPDTAAAERRNPERQPTQQEVNRMMQRLEEIKAMDLEHMPRSERRALTKEVKQLKKKVQAVGGGLYISAGALILIVVLLILLF